MRPVSCRARPGPLRWKLRLAATVERLRREVRAAQAEAEGRALIELAKGILVERLGCGPSQAARQLAELAEQSKVPQLQLAVEIINQAAHDRLSEVTRTFLATTAERAAEDEAPAVRLRAAESGALAADDTQAVADSLLQHALTPLGAVAVAIWAAGADGSLSLAGSAGFSAAEARRWRYVPPGVATMARRALSDRTTQWAGSLAGTGLPSIGHAVHPDGGRVAVAVAPGAVSTASWRSSGRPSWNPSRRRSSVRSRRWPSCARTLWRPTPCRTTATTCGERPMSPN